VKALGFGAIYRLAACLTQDAKSDPHELGEKWNLECVAKNRKSNAQFDHIYTGRKFA